MQLKTLAGLTMAAALALPLVTHAASDGDKEPGAARAWVRDSVITTKIKAQLAANQPASLAKVHVDTDAKGNVRLTGKVDTQADADRSVAIAKAVDGVSRVESKIQVTGDK